MSVTLRKYSRGVRGLKIVFRLVFAVFFLLMLMAVVLYSQLSPVNPEEQEERMFTIEQGAIPRQIASDLEEQGFIKSRESFLCYARLTGRLSEFKAGNYMLSPSYSVPRIMDLIVKGKVATLKFTIPEGYHLRQIAGVLVKKGLTTEEEFWKAVTEEDYGYPFLEGIKKDERRLEGYLFPDTYTIPQGYPVKKILDAMLKRFEQVVEKLPPNNTGLSLHEIVTLASIVESESLLDKERPIIASVFLNRLAIGMKLDSCATIQYLFDEHKEQVLLADLEIESPYNTYKNKGLPPGPIGSPGEASLRAVLQPADTDYLYFVAKKDSSGEHVFSTTYQEHLNNKRRLGY